jgi:hypothetical protein
MQRGIEAGPTGAVEASRLPHAFLLLPNGNRPHDFLLDVSCRRPRFVQGHFRLFLPPRELCACVICRARLPVPRGAFKRIGFREVDAAGGQDRAGWSRLRSRWLMTCARRLR